MEQLTLFDKELIRTWPTREQIAKARYTKAQLAAWGISWPPPKGWRATLEREADARTAGDGSTRCAVDAAGFREQFPHLYRQEVNSGSGHERDE